jgi:hypothetical protein
MRDQNRIPKVLRAIEKIWRRYPDWRLGQLVANIAEWADESIWDLEEEELVAEIEKHLKAQTSPVNADTRPD